MDKLNEQQVTPIELISLVNSHDKPFVVIDKNYRILAVNQAYEHAYGASSDDAIGKMCYQVSHGNERPCSEEGEECPHEHIFSTGDNCICAHIHCDSNHRMHQVKVSAYPLRGANGELYMGECIEEITSPEDRRSGGERMVGETPSFLACLKQLDIAASSEAPVLLQGETGTGKDLAANYIHQHSSRCDKPFLTLDCTVLTESLFDTPQKLERRRVHMPMGRFGRAGEIAACPSSRPRTSAILPRTFSPGRMNRPMSIST